MTQLSAYELKRLDTIEANRKVMISLGLESPIVPKQEKPVATRKRKQPSEDPDYVPERRVTRVIRGKATVAAGVVDDDDDDDDDDEDDDEDRPSRVRQSKPKSAVVHVKQEKPIVSAPAKDACITVEAAKTGRSKCRCCLEPLAAGAARVGMESWMVGRQVVVWQHPACFVSGLSVSVEATGRTKCKQTKEAFAAGERRLSATAHTTTANLKLSVAPRLLRPVYAALPDAERESLPPITGNELLEASERAALEAALVADESAGPPSSATNEAAETAVDATPSTTDALAAGGATDAPSQPAKGRVTKTKGWVCWRFAGALCYGTLLPAQESKTTCYARTHKGNTKTLTKGGSYWWLMDSE